MINKDIKSVEYKCGLELCRCCGRYKEQSYDIVSDPITL